MSHFIAKQFRDPDSEPELGKPGWSAGPAVGAASWVGGRVRGEVQGRVLGWVRGWVQGRVRDWVKGWVQGRVRGRVQGRVGCGVRGRVSPAASMLNRCRSHSKPAVPEPWADCGDENQHQIFI